MSYTDRIARGGGPESSAYDKRRHEKMRPKPMGLLRSEETIGLKAMPVKEICDWCNRVINEATFVRINGEPFHEKCFNARCQKLSGR